jgi:superfamily II DNA/RNA helicase
MERDPVGIRQSVPKHHSTARKRDRPVTCVDLVLDRDSEARPESGGALNPAAALSIVSQIQETILLAFSDFDLHPNILKALDAAGFADPTPIQAAAIPLALAGRDLIGSAQTGTGKTAAFMLPALNRLAEPKLPRPHGPRVLVLAPTRELAQQILEATRKLGKFLRLHTVSVLGGMPYRVQLRELSRPIDVMVATPGRLIDLLDRKAVNLADLELLVLDEADRMLDMGFIEAVETIAALTPATRQTVLFTATFDRRLTALASKLLKNPERVAIEATMTVASIEQRLIVSDDMKHKRKLLAHLAASPELGKAIVFAATKRDADQLAEELRAAGRPAAALHGDMTQGARNATVRQLREGRVRVLVATDVAARGIDVPDLTHVINFDLPRQAEDYVHRIGRTGRNGASGIAISFAAPADRIQLERIERFTGSKLVEMIIPGLEPTVSLQAHHRPRPSGSRFRPWAEGNKGKPGFTATRWSGERRPAANQSGGLPGGGEGKLRRAG